MAYTNGVYFPPIIRNAELGSPGLDHCSRMSSRIQAPGSASLVYDSFLWSQESCCASRKGGRAKGKEIFFFSLEMGILPTSYWLKLDHMTTPSCKGHWVSSFFMLYSLFNLRGSVLLLKARWSENWKVWPVHKEAQVVISHWVCFCLAVMLSTTGPLQRWCCHCSSSLDRPWGSHAWFSCCSHSGYTHMHSQYASIISLVERRLGHQGLLASTATCVRYGPSMILETPIFSLGHLSRGCHFLTGRPQTRSSPIHQRRSGTAEHFSGGNQNLHAFPTGDSLTPLQICTPFSPNQLWIQESLIGFISIRPHQALFCPFTKSWGTYPYIIKRAHTRGSSWTQICLKVICHEHLGRETTMLKICRITLDAPATCMQKWFKTEGDLRLLDLQYDGPMWASLKETAGILGNISQIFFYLLNWAHKKRKVNLHGPEIQRNSKAEANLLATLWLLWRILAFVCLLFYWGIISI